MKYTITSITGPFGEEAEPDAGEMDPQNAIIQWCRRQKEKPTCGAIMPKTIEDGTKLLEWARDNFDKIEVWMIEHKVPYKKEWLKEQIETTTNGMQWDGDQIFPFCMG